MRVIALFGDSNLCISLYSYYLQAIMTEFVNEEATHAIQMTGRIQILVEKAEGTLCIFHYDNLLIAVPGFYRDDGHNELKYAPFVAVRIGNKVFASTSPWTQVSKDVILGLFHDLNALQEFTFPHWNENLTLDFTNEREIEVLCYAEKVYEFI